MKRILSAILLVLFCAVTSSAYDRIFRKRMRIMSAPLMIMISRN